MTGQDKTLAARTVTGVIAGMVAATATATAVGFWLSYAGLHSFALRAGLHGAEAWAWPGSVDLFILAGEAGVTISALRRHQDKAAWLYLAIGFAASVTANVLHVDPSALHWTRYAVAAVPPVAAMLALAALLRQVYRLAEVGQVAGQKQPARPGKTPVTKRPRPAATKRTAGRTSGPDREAAVMSALAADPAITTSQLATMTGLSDRTVRRYRSRLNGAST